MPQAKMEVALQFSECCAAGTALQHCLFCSAEVIWIKSCAAANQRLHCNIEKAALQESGAFLPLSCGFQAPTFRHPRFGPADCTLDGPNRQSPIASVQRTWSTLAGHSASPRGTNTRPSNANRAIRIAAQRTQGPQGPYSVLWGGDMAASGR